MVCVADVNVVCVKVCVVPSGNVMVCVVVVGVGAVGVKA